jgi:DNA invertase Pin-like site-specific DNA recombinase
MKALYPEMKPPKAYSYLRFSTPEQSRGDSFRRQIAMADAYAARHGLTIDTSVTLEDRGISAHRGRNRTEGALGDFAELVKSGEIEEGSFLLIENLDRYSRQNPIEAASQLQKLCQMGVTLVTLNDEQVYTKDSLVNNIGSILQAILGFERAYKESYVKGQRLKAAWAQKRVVAGGADARVLTSVCPAWLKLDKETGKFLLVPERAEIVRRIFGDTLQGCSPHSIAHAFNHEPVPVFGEGKKKGKEWYRSYVIKILANRACIGVLTPHTYDYVSDPKNLDAPEKRQRTATAEIPGYFPAVIDADTFNRVQALRKDRRSSPRGRHSAHSIVHPISNIFSGLGRCGYCGGTMTRANKGGRRKQDGDKGAQSVYLVCVAAKTAGGCKGGYILVPYPRVEQAFLRDIKSLVASAPAGDKAKGLDAEIENLESALLGTEDTLEAWLSAVGKAPSVALAKRIRELEADREEAKRSLDDLLERRETVSGKFVKSRLANLKAVATADPIDRTLLNTALRETVSSVEVDAEQGQLVFHWRHGGESEIVYGMEKQTQPKPTIGANNRKRSTLAKKTTR